MTDLLMPRMFYWCMENHAPASTTLGEIPRERCSFVIERRTEFDVYVTTSNTKEENDLKECLYGNPSLPKLFAINQWCMIPPPTGTLWLYGTSSWFGNLLGKPWLWIKEIAILLFFSPTCVLSMHPQYQVFLAANDARLSRGNDSSNQKRLLPVRTSRTLYGRTSSQSF